MNARVYGRSLPLPVLMVVESGVAIAGEAPRGPREPRFLTSGVFDYYRHMARKLLTPGITMLVILIAGILLISCGGNTNSSNGSAAQSTPPPPKVGFEADLEYVRKGQYTYVWVFSRKDGQPLDKEDGAYLRANAPQVVDWVTSEGGKKVIAGTNFDLALGNLDLLKKRFVVEDYTSK